jgi:hypothetical protein
VAAQLAFRLRLAYVSTRRLAFAPSALATIALADFSAFCNSLFVGTFDLSGHRFACPTLVLLGAFRLSFASLALLGWLWGIVSLASFTLRS